uniref:Uncharacterized protein n=1 Tax=Strongyloides venezuelensis TaxID=75913 RepID=A0A0K0F6F1_STRVS
MPIAGIEPTSPRPQRGVLTTILNRPRSSDLSFQNFSLGSLRIKIEYFLQFCKNNVFNFYTHEVVSNSINRIMT